MSNEKTPTTWQKIGKELDEIGNVQDMRNLFIEIMDNYIKDPSDLKYILNDIRDFKENS